MIFSESIPKKSIFFWNISDNYEKDVYCFRLISSSLQSLHTSFLMWPSRLAVFSFIYVCFFACFSSVCDTTPSASLPRLSSFALTSTPPLAPVVSSLPPGQHPSLRFRHQVFLENTGSKRVVPRVQTLRYCCRQKA